MITTIKALALDYLISGTYLTLFLYVIPEAVSGVLSIVTQIVGIIVGLTLAALHISKIVRGEKKDNGK